MNARGIKTKDWTSRGGRHHAGQRFSESMLRRLLGNVLYIGSIRHKGTIYPGEQQGLVEEALWKRVSENLTLQGLHQQGRAHHKQETLLGGLLHCGSRLNPTFTRQRTYRYYACDCT